jgi:hypothetical protein
MYSFGLSFAALQAGEMGPQTSWTRGLPAGSIKIQDFSHKLVMQNKLWNCSFRHFSVAGNKNPIMKSMFKMTFTPPLRSSETELQQQQMDISHAMSYVHKLWNIQVPLFLAQQ